MEVGAGTTEHPRRLLAVLGTFLAVTVVGNVAGFQLHVVSSIAIGSALGVAMAFEYLWDTDFRKKPFPWWSYIVGLALYGGLIGAAFDRGNFFEDLLLVAVGVVVSWVALFFCLVGIMAYYEATEERDPSEAEA